MNKPLLITFALALIFLYSTFAWADFDDQIDLGPDFQQCIKQTETMGQDVACYSEANKYWGQKLESVYNRVLQQCEKTENSASCAEKVKKMQRSWLQYTSAMKGFLRDGGIPPEEKITEFIWNGARFEATSTKLQYEWLRMLLQYK